MSTINSLWRRTQLALYDFGPSITVLMMPGGYLIALAELIDRHWPYDSPLKLTPHSWGSD
ncbi:MAG TPA: hypothetical protein VK727_22100 [Steroidobacteraceae bacterium]|nr:hypothetical protein [Steroidobacteraceae bacterium]